MDAAVAMPKLRKNKRIDNKWGLKYHAAVREAVFGMQSVPYMPSEPPPSLSEDVSEHEPLYVCKQCKDCFRFLTSYEDHNTRRSWILGYWCQICFLTICTHSRLDPCPNCRKLDRDKRLYLRTRGLKQSHKIGATRVFYNQCQFFAHLKTHNLTTVDMGDIMLMPLPTETINDWHPELDKACEALMEHSFLLRIHVVDWLRAENVDKNWWKLVNSNETKGNPISKILQSYEGRRFFPIKTNVSRGDMVNLKFSNFMLNSTTKCKSSEKSDTSYKSFATDVNSPIRNLETPTTDNNVSENEDNPCTSADIEFVDCESLSQHYSLETPSSSVKQKFKPTYVKTEQSLLKDFQPISSVHVDYKCKKSKSNVAYDNLSDIPFHCGNTTIMAKVDVKPTKRSSAGPRSWKNGRFIQRINSKISSDTSLKGKIGFGTKNTLNETSPEKVSHMGHADHSSVKKPKLSAKSAKGMQALQVTGMSSNPKILTFQSSKNVDLNSIITQLSPHLLANNSIVLIGQDSEKVSTNKQESHCGKKSKATASNLIHDRKGKLVSNSVVPVFSYIEDCKDAGKNSEKVQAVISDSTNDAILNGKVVYQNGRRYVIKSSHDPNRMASSVDLLKDTEAQNSSSDYTGLSKFSPDATLESSAAAQHNLSQSDVSLLTPSPSPSELSTSSSEVHSKQTKNGIQLSKVSSFECKVSAATSNKGGHETLSFDKDKNGNSYLNIQVIYDKQKIITFNEEMAAECREGMMKNFGRLNRTELKERINYMQQVRSELEAAEIYLDKSIYTTNVDSINELEQRLNDALECCKDPEDTAENSSINVDVFSNDWEQDYRSDKRLNCVTCSKIVKPKSYIAGFSKQETDDTYCSCYKCICHECCTYEGDLTRFIAHQNFHKKRKPYACPDCYQKFSSFKLLEVHTWTDCFHMLKKQLFGCKICNVKGFRDMESVTRHYATMHCEKRLACGICYLTVSSYAAYEKHCKDEHASATGNVIKVVICLPDKCIVRCENYVSHLERHRSITKLTSVKCPFCPFGAAEDKITSTTYQTHLYSEHLDHLSSIIDPNVLLEILPSNLAKEIFVANSPTSSDSANMNFTNTSSGQDEDNTIVPKIVNTRTIPSEVFESGVQAIGEDLRRHSGSSTASESTFQNNDECSSRFANPDNMESSDILEMRAEASSPFTCEGLDPLPKILDVRSTTSTAQRASNSRSKDAKSKRPVKNVSSTFKYQTDLRDQLCDKFHRIINANSSENDFSSALERVGEQHRNNDKKSTSSASSTLKSDRHESVAWSSGTDQASTNYNSSVAKPSLFNSEDTHIANKDIQSQTSKHQNVNTDRRLRVFDIDEINSQFMKESAGSLNSSTNNCERTNSLPLPKPPPLARIPQHLLDMPTVKQEKEEKVQKKHVVHRQSNNRKATNRKRQSRIALNGPTVVNEEPFNYLCHICGDMINTSWPFIRSHFTEKHAHDYKLCAVTPRLLRISPDFINGRYKEIYGSKKRKSESILSASKRRRRWTPKKYVDSASGSVPGLGLCVKQESAEDADGNFKCKKCNQCCADMSDLREHIASNHRIKGRYLICLECGENFVVAPSLQMHLKAFHGIEDPVTYLSQNTSYAPDIIDDFDGEGKTTVANQCHVCMAVFEDKAAVDKHLRVHGMAFLNRKRIEARNAQISPEKKTKTEADSCVKEEIKPVETNVSDISKSVRKDDPAETILEKINATV